MGFLLGSFSALGEGATTSRQSQHLGEEQEEQEFKAALSYTGSSRSTRDFNSKGERTGLTTA